MWKKHRMSCVFSRKFQLMLVSALILDRYSWDYTLCHVFYPIKCILNLQRFNKTCWMLSSIKVLFILFPCLYYVIAEVMLHFLIFIQYCRWMIEEGYNLPCSVFLQWIAGLSAWCWILTIKQITLSASLAQTAAFLQSPSLTQVL